MTVEVIRLEGLTPYAEGLRQQIERRDAVAQGEAAEALFVLEHAPVITLGRNAHEENLLKPRSELANMGIEVIETDRGGDVTYHGPGQLVAYPILSLKARGRAIRGYLRSLEGVLLQTLRAWDLDGELSPGQTGAWVKGAKVAAIGVGLKRWVTYHGVSLNVAPDMAHFETIIPCGIPDRPVTSLAELLSHPPTMDEAAEAFARAFLGDMASP